MLYGGGDQELIWVALCCLHACLIADSTRREQTWACLITTQFHILADSQPAKTKKLQYREGLTYNGHTKLSVLLQFGDCRGAPKPKLHRTEARTGMVRKRKEGEGEREK